MILYATGAIGQVWGNDQLSDAPNAHPFDTEPQTRDALTPDEIDLHLRPTPHCYFGSVIQEHPYAYNYGLSAQGLISSAEDDILDIDSFPR